MLPRRVLLLLAAAFLLRLIHLGAPPVGYSSWRQADTAAIARNFHENGYRFLYPQVDWGGAGEGYVESEFPVYPFAVSLLYGLFGVSESAGRLLSALCAAAAIAFLFILVRRTIDERTAFWSAAAFAFLPLNVYYGGAFMPESALLMCLVLAVLFFERWAAGRGPAALAAAALFTALAGLLKLPSLYIGGPLVFLAWRAHGPRFLLKPSLWAFAAAVLLPVGLWYAHAHRLAAEGGVSFGIWEYGTDKWGNWDLVFTAAFWEKILLKWLAERHLAFAGSVLLAAGLALRRRTGGERLYDVWCLSLLVYVVIAAKGNYVHEYYLLPAMIPVSVFIGKLLARHATGPPRLAGRRMVLGILVAATGVLGAVRYASYLAAEDSDGSDLVRLAERVKEETAPGDLVIAVDGGNPTLLYLCHRKGWHAHPDDLTPDFVSDRIGSGARYIIGLERDAGAEAVVVDLRKAPQTR